MLFELQILKQIQHNVALSDSLSLMALTLMRSPRTQGILLSPA